MAKLTTRHPTIYRQEIRSPDSNWSRQTFNEKLFEDWKEEAREQRDDGNTDYREAVEQYFKFYKGTIDWVEVAL